MAKVELIDFTGKGRPDEHFYAAQILIFTKSTRLNMTPGLFKKIQEMYLSEIYKELEYMASTIPSSWEFVDVTFLVSNVTRACAQQMTRTRTGSYAMQSQRVADLSEITVENPFQKDDEQNELDNFLAYEKAVKNAKSAYSYLANNGAKKEDARGILPINSHCNIVCKYNLRNFVDLIQARKSLRAQGEYVDIADQMFKSVIEVWPWSEKFFESKHEKAIALLEEAAKTFGITTGSGFGWQVAKAIDLLRKEK